MRDDKNMDEKQRTALIGDIVEAMEPLIRKVVREELPSAATNILTPEAVEQFWNIGFEVMKKQAANRVGLWAFGRIGTLANLLFWGAMGLYIAYQVAGWAGVKLLLAKGA